MDLLGTKITPLGMGCWPIGGQMFSGDQPLGYAKSDDAESIRTIHAAMDHGIRIFDTAAVYGAGHAERLLAQALGDRPDAMIITKIGIAIDEEAKQLTGDEIDTASVIPAIDRGLDRLNRECIDILLLHQNTIPLEQAEPIFVEMEKARCAGKIRAYGWSTDISSSARAMASNEGFVAVEHAMNVLLDAPAMQTVAEESGLHALIRSPLGMGLLTGKYDAQSIMPSDDIRSTSNPKTNYFEGARVNPKFLKQLDAIQDLLTTNGRTMAQGALSWLWAKSDNNIPIPGARTVEQIEGIAGAIGFGPLSNDVMAQIEGLIDRPIEGELERAR